MKSIHAPRNPRRIINCLAWVLTLSIPILMASKAGLLSAVGFQLMVINLVLILPLILLANLIWRATCTHYWLFGLLVLLCLPYYLIIFGIWELEDIQAMAMPFLLLALNTVLVGLAMVIAFFIERHARKKRDIPYNSTETP
jgi:hypothetical protein